MRKSLDKISVIYSNIRQMSADLSKDRFCCDAHTRFLEALAKQVVKGKFTCEEACEARFERIKLLQEHNQPLCERFLNINLDQLSQNS